MKKKGKLKIMRDQRNITIPVAAAVLAIILFLSGEDVAAQVKCEWPGFHGRDRTNKSTETGLLKEWPANGPKLVMTIEGLGEGYSSVAIADGLIYTAGSVKNQPWIFAFNLQGKLVWKSMNGKAWSTSSPWASSYTGPRSTPLCNDGIVYHLGEMGRLAAFDSKTGRELWHRDLMEEFGAAVPEYGYAESVAADGDKLYVRPAGKKGHQICINKKTGKLVWANTEIPGAEGYTSPVIAEAGGYRQVFGASAVCYYGADALTGKLLWTVSVRNQQLCNIPDVIVHNDYVFIASGYGFGSMLLRLKASGNGVVPEKVWQSSLMDNHHGGVILHNGFLYGSGHRASRGWHCIDFMTGKQRWKAANEEGCITFADGMLYTLEQRGIMRLVSATPDKYEVKGEFRVPPGGRDMYWAHPVVCGKRLYIRHANKIFVYDISAGSQKKIQ